MALAEVLSQIERDAPRRYSRWSTLAWRLACEGPALRLWDGLSGDAPSTAIFESYLLLLREGIGFQYLSAEDVVTPGGTFLATALCDVAPRLLPKAPPAARAAGLAQLWNAGEKLLEKPLWLNRYLSVRLSELTDLATFPAFLERVLEEGLEAGTPAAWTGAYRPTIVDPSRFDRAFLPGEMHLATSAVVCVHDRRRPGRHAALLLRKTAKGGPIPLGATPCLGRDGAPAPYSPTGPAYRNALSASGLTEILGWAAVRTGFLLYTTPLSQRLWVVEAER